ncbi:hypothetical protein INT46_007153 [Mucor plumbeus]|uniref:Uncharacterized protein n=1 Tax=Mucor plumbeus TaxID=97098 RepID=A0A8H7QZP9_9FUNG|nr:hypothetical protein INT46_007153 [Mucor plumbeus]
MAEAGKSASEKGRFYNVMKWFITALNGSFTSRIPTENGTRAICEQVSHHLPVSDFIIKTDTSSISITVNDEQKTRFSGTQILVDQIGYCIFEMKQHALHVELFSIYYIQSSTGFHAAIEYATRG